MVRRSHRTCKALVASRRNAGCSRTEALVPEPRNKSLNACDLSKPVSQEWDSFVASTEMETVGGVGRETS